MTELVVWLSTAFPRFALDAAWQSTLIGVIALVWVRVLRPRPAARAAVMLAALSLCIATPAASYVARSAGLGLLAADDSTTGVVLLSDATGFSTLVPNSDSAKGTLRPRTIIQRVLPNAWIWRACGAVWLLASCAFALRLVLSAAALRRACHDATVCNDADISAELQRAAASLGVNPPALGISRHVDAPSLVVLGRARLLLPDPLSVRDDWYAIFCHELAHMARHDGFARVATELAVVLLPWQPLVWLLRRDFRAACEEACDDWAVDAGADPVEFAALLLDFVPQAGADPTARALVLGMAESVPAARQRILRLLAMHDMPRPRLGKLFGVGGWFVAAALLVVIALMQSGHLGGSRATDLPPWGNLPVEKPAINGPARLVALPTYRVEPPDVLLIDVVKVVPKPPYKIEPLDTLKIFVLGTLPDQSISGSYPVEADGTVELGAAYGTIKVSELTLGEARQAIREKLEEMLSSPEVSVSLAESAGQQQIQGEHLIGPDGTVNIGIYGSVFVAGMTLSEARAAIEKHLTEFLDKPKVSVDVFAFNSKFYYVIVEGKALGDSIQRVPITGNETVLDAITQIGGLSRMTEKTIWISRPATADGKMPARALPVNWREIIDAGDTSTNWQILPGDRVFVSEKKWK